MQGGSCRTVMKGNGREGWLGLFYSTVRLAVGRQKLGGVVGREPLSAGVGRLLQGFVTSPGGGSTTSLCRG